MAEKYGNEMPPSGDMKEDEKTLEQACSTLLVAALSPELDGASPPFLVLSLAWYVVYDC